jgi:hypothetical protein
MATEAREAFLLPIPLLSHNLKVMSDAPELHFQGGAFYAVDVRFDPERLPRDRPLIPIRAGRDAARGEDKAMQATLAALDRRTFNSMLVDADCVPLRTWLPAGEMQAYSLSQSPTLLRFGWEMRLDTAYQVEGQVALLHQIEARRENEQTYFFLCLDARLFTAQHEWKTPEIAARIRGLLERVLAPKPPLESAKSAS